MKAEEILHMVGGNGPSSYASNSKVQEKVVLQTMPLLEKAIENISSILNGTLVAADLGCSSGPNTFLVMSGIIAAMSKSSIYKRGRDPEIQFYLNDLPGNDFNNIFASLDSNNKKIKKEIADEDACPIYYVYGVPGSFYGRLFPRSSVHLFHSSYCLHWLSQPPPGLKNHKDSSSLNNNDIYITKTSPTAVQKLYLEQFSKDFATFLKSRSEETLGGGQMILSFLGRKSSDPTRSELCFTWGLLAEAINSMVKEGLVEEDKLKAFDLPFYTPSMEEVKLVVKSEGSFELVQGQILEQNCDPFDDSNDNTVVDKFTIAQNIANIMKSVVEPMLVQHFGEAIIDDVFSRYEKNILNHLLKGETKYTVLVVALKTK